MPVLIAPSVLPADFSKIGEEVRALDEAGVDIIQWDVMDGQFVPNLTFGLATVEALRGATKLPFDAHLMISHADQYLDAFAAAGVDGITIHVEASAAVGPTLDRIGELGLKRGVSLNPDTSLRP